MRKTEASCELVNDTMKSMLENTRDFMFVKDKNLSYVGVSKAFALDCACHSGTEDIIGKTDFEVFEDRSYAEKYRKDDEELLHSGISKIEYREAYPGKNGEIRYCLTTKYLIRDKVGNPAGVFGQGHDITEQVRLEQLEGIQKKKLSQDISIFKAMQNVYEVVLYFDFKNDSYYQVVGEKYATEIIRPTGILSKMVPIWMQDDLSAKMREENSEFVNLSTMPERLTKHGILTKEMQSLRFGWVRISLLPVNRDENGNVSSCLWVCETINDEMKTRSNLQTRNEILEALRNVYDICMYWNLAEDIYFRVYGKDDDVQQIVPDQGTLHEILPVWINDDLTEENRIKCKDFYDLNTLVQRLTQNGTLTMEIETIHSGWLRTSLVPTSSDEDGMVNACLWVGEVIDEQKKERVSL